MKNFSKLFFAALLMLTSIGFAQLSDRVNAPSTYVIGTRPESGNYGVQIGTSYQDIATILDDGKDFQTLPVVALKYYNSSDVVYSLGIKSSKTKVAVKGTILSTSDEIKYKQMTSQLMLVPGIEKHFGAANILDVYIGGRVPFGLDREISISEFSGAVDIINNSTRNSLGYGFDFFVGIQAFIGDLPFAIGAEIEYSAFGRFGDKYKVDDGTNVYYDTNVGGGIFAGTQFEKLSANTFDVETDLRIFLVYFFRR